MGTKNSRIEKTEKSLEAEGIRFTKPNNKSLRLYFQSQFTHDMDEEEFKFLNHIFELKVYLFFHKYYDKGHLLDVDKFLEETFEKNIETIYQEIKDIEISEGDEEEFQNNRELFDNYFSFIRKVSEQVVKSNNTCIVNQILKYMNIKDVPEKIILSRDFINDIKLTRELEMYTLLNDNTNIIYMVLTKFFELFDIEKNLKKLTIYQVSIKTVDELMYTIIANFLNKNPQIESVNIVEKNPNSGRDDIEERLENPIINRQHFFNFYQVLSKKSNLIELRVMLFLRDYNLILLSHVLKHNKNLKILQVRNVYCKDTETLLGRELDFSYYELCNLGEHIRDEIFIFFNYLSQLEFLEELQLTHFWFNSEINFLTTEVSKNMKYLKFLSLSNNQAIINNDATAYECYNLEQTNIEKLDMGLTYYNMVRRFDYIINTDKLHEVNIGVLDFISFSAFIKFIEHTNLEKVICSLNKPCSIDSIPILFEQLSDHPFRAKNLKYFYILNAYSNTTYKDKKMDFYLLRLIQKLKENKTVRKLSFKRPGTYLSPIKETEEDKLNERRTFRYIGKKNYPKCIDHILALRVLFKYENFEENFETDKKIEKNIFFTQIFKKIIHFKFASYRKLVLD
jgi:hypothetical protein